MELDWAVRPVPSVKFDTELHLDDFGGQRLSPFAQQLELIQLGMKHQRGQVFVATPPNIDRTKLGVNSGYHTLGHRAAAHQKEFEDMLKVEQYLMDAFSDFVTNLKNDGSLDDTIVLFMGAYSNLGSHRRESLPVVLAGSGFRHQGLIDCVRNGALQHPLSHLYVDRSIRRSISCRLNPPKAAQLLCWRTIGCTMLGERGRGISPQITSAFSPTESSS